VSFNQHVPTWHVLFRFYFEEGHIRAMCPDRMCEIIEVAISELGNSIDPIALEYYTRHRGVGVSGSPEPLLATSAAQPHTRIDKT